MIDVYSVAYATSSLICLLVASAAWRRRPAPGAVGLALLCFAQFLWSGAFALQWSLTAHEPSFSWLVVRLAFLQITPTATLVFVLDFTGHGKWLTRRTIGLLLIQPLFIILMAATEPLHGLYLGGAEPGMVVTAGGPVLLLNLVYSYALNLLCAGLLATRLGKGQPYRTQTTVIIVAVMLPVAHFLMQVLGAKPLAGVNSVPFTFTISGLLMFFAVTRLGLFQVLPVARDRLIEQMADGIVVFDARNRVADINPAAMRILRPTACLGRTAEEAFPAQLEAIESLRAQLAIGRPRPTVRSSYGDGGVVDITASPLLKGDGERMATLITLRDVTEQARAEAEIASQAAELSAARERAAHVLEAMSEGVLLLDAAGIILQYNRAASRMLQPHARHLAKARVREVLPSVPLATLIDEARSIGGSSFSTATLPDSRTLAVEVVPLTETDAQSTHAVVILRDETERHATERMQRDFIDNAAHELQTPLTGLSLLAETIPRALDKDPDSARSFVERLSIETRRLVHMTNSLLTLSTVERTPADAELDRVDVSRLLAEQVTGLQLVAESRRQELSLDVEPRLLIRGSEPDVRAVVKNLVENALYYTHEGGTIRVQARNVRKPGAEWIEIVVHDNGDGIPSEDLERIFERFYRVDKARSRQTGGAGLGLSIVRAAVERHGGTVEVLSASGKGSTFTVRLPAAPDTD